ncbi:MAG: hypothetical protein Q9217_000208 [Psora testacea]
MSTSGDEDLQRAIALSLGKPDPVFTSASAGASIHDAIELASDDEIDSEVHGHGNYRHGGLDRQPSITSRGIVGLNRKQMEEERLARKRRRSSSPRAPLKIPRQEPAPCDCGLFLSGTVKKTWVLGHERVGDDIKLEEVLQKDDLQLAVLSSFQWDIPWLLAKMSMEKTKITLVVQAKDQFTRTQYLEETSQMSNLRLCFPSMEGQINCMHSKLMLLSHPKYVRVVIPTANLVRYDWGETGEMENMVFLIDLPRLPEGKRIAKEDLTFFGRELLYFLEAMGSEQTIIDSLCAFDFAATKDIAFVHTIGGAHSGEAWRRTGYCGLGRAVKELADILYVRSNENLSIDFVTSSVGSLDMGFLGRVFAACQGNDGLEEYTPKCLRTGKATKTSQERVYKFIEKAFRIYFPTHETVTASVAGYAGTICIQPKYYDNPKFPQQLMRDCKSIRDGVLMHNKLMFVRPESGGKAWAYVGSANCSESAWGNKLVTDKVTKLPKLNCRNWECGVLISAGPGVHCVEYKPIFPPESRASSVQTSNRSASGGGLQVFKGVIPVPMHYPGEEYGDRKPWYFQGNG